MEEIACERSQFDVPFGSLSCMAASMCVARLFLDADIRREDLERSLDAGAAIHKAWSAQTQLGPARMQCWTDVVKTVPGYMKGGVKVLYEGNGLFGAKARGEATVLYEDVQAEMNKRHDKRSAGVFTSDGGSYMVGRDASFWYCFDPHGATTGGEKRVATLRRSSDADAMALYVRDEAIGATDADEFHVVLFGKT